VDFNGVFGVWSCAYSGRNIACAGRTFQKILPMKFLYVFLWVKRWHYALYNNVRFLGTLS